MKSAQSQVVSSELLRVLGAEDPPMLQHERNILTIPLRTVAQRRSNTVGAPLLDRDDLGKFGGDAASEDVASNRRPYQKAATPLHLQRQWRNDHPTFCERRDEGRCAV